MDLGTGTIGFYRPMCVQNGRAAPAIPGYNVGVLSLKNCRVGGPIGPRNLIMNRIVGEWKEWINTN